MTRISDFLVFSSHSNVITGIRNKGGGGGQNKLNEEQIFLLK